MAQKRKAREAFGKCEGPISAFAAAKLARQSAPPTTEPEKEGDGGDLAAAVAVAAEPYDGHHSGTITSAAGRVDAEVATPPSRHPAVRLSTVEPKQLKVQGDDGNALQASLQSNETLVLVGEYDLQVIKGIVTVYGSVIRPNSGVQRIYAPSTQALPEVQARQDGTSIRIASVKSSLRKLEKLSPLFRNIWATEGRSFAVLGTTDDDQLQRSLTALEIEKETDTVLRTLSAKISLEARKPRIMAIGAKSSGKSTFNRLLYNHIHSWKKDNTCLYLDLDPGQPEFGPPGQLSLVQVTAPILGPPFTHPATQISANYKLIRSHTIAATSLKEDSELYKACAADLMQHTNKNHPLIVNSCGWVTGVGASVLVDLISILGISDIVLLEPVESALVEALQLQAGGSLTMHKISRRPPKPSSRTPAENRAMLTMAYFHHRPTTSDEVLRWSGKPISNVRPWIVSYAGTNSGILAVLSHGQSPDPEFLSEVLDGSIVAIVVLTDDDASSDLADHIQQTPAGLPYIAPTTQGVVRTIDPASSHCVGLALIRGIDAKAQELHLMTPLPESQIAELIERRVALVRGSFDPPEWAYLEDVYKDDSGDGNGEVERPWVGRKDTGGIEGAVWRLRHPPMAAAVAASR